MAYPILIQAKLRMMVEVKHRRHQVYLKFWTQMVADVSFFSQSLFDDQHDVTTHIALRTTPSPNLFIDAGTQVPL